MKITLRNVLLCILLLAVMLSSTMGGLASTRSMVSKNAPYSPPVSGIFHEQKIITKDYQGIYSIYIPSNFEPCSPGVMLLTPDGVSAKEFFEGDIGSSWKSLARSSGFSLVIVEPRNGANWNLALSNDRRNDEALIKKIYDTIRSKDNKISAAFDLNERAFYLVGYDEGGSAAHKVAMAWPEIFCGAVSVGGSVVPESVIKSLGDTYSYPFAQADSLDGRQENKLANKNIPVPFWIVENEKSAKNSSLVEKYWIDANKVSDKSSNNYAQKVYESSNPAVKLWVTKSSSSDLITPRVIWDEFLSKTQRFVGDPGGRLVGTVSHTNNGSTGFFYSEENVNGYIRRWLTYVPSSYDKSKRVPLVVAIHGYSSAITAFTGDSHWQDVAEENGFIVVFPQAYPVNGGYGGSNIPVPYWSNYSGPAYSEAPNDVDFLVKLINMTKSKYAIDSERVFATGHSNGSGMSWRLALDVPEVFTAVAPVGLTAGAYKDGTKALDNPLPIWAFKGEYDIDYGAEFDYSNKSNTNVKALQEWTKINGLDINSVVETVDVTGRYVTKTYTNGQNEIPLYKYTTVKNAPHAYHPEQAEMIWKEFFSHITKDSAGQRYYDGTKIV